MNDFPGENTPGENDPTRPGPGEANAPIGSGSPESYESRESQLESPEALQERIAALEGMLADKDKVIDTLSNRISNLEDTVRDLTNTVDILQPESPQPEGPRRGRTPPTPPSDTFPRHQDSFNRDRGNGNRLSNRLAVAAAIGVAAVGGFFGGFLVGGGFNSGKNQDTTPVALLANKHHGPASHNRLLLKAEADNTVAQAVKDLHPNDSTIKSDIRAIANESHTQLVNHDRGSMSSLRAEFGNRQLTADQYAAAVAFSVRDSSGYAAKEYNVLTGNPNSNTLPAGVTVEQARQDIFNMMTAPGTTFNVEQPGGTYLNHGQRVEQVFNAGIIQLTRGDQDVFVIQTAEGQQLYFKVFDNNCVNILTKITLTLPPPEQAAPPAAPLAPPEHRTPPVPHRHHPPHHRVPHHHPSPKTAETGGTPANVPGANGGTGIKSPETGPGKGPIKQHAGPNGVVPGETIPATPAPTPTPNPIENTPAPAGGETGQNNGPNQAPPVSTPDTGNTVAPPTGDFNPSGN